MIFTIGKIEVYEKYLASDNNAAKRRGGSVWETYDGAFAYLTRVNLIGEFKVYGVDADWEKDTKSERGADGWKVLRKNATLIKV
jgi:hypothetical protein